MALDGWRATFADPRAIHERARETPRVLSTPAGPVTVVADAGGLRDLFALPSEALAPRRTLGLPRGWADRSVFFLAGAEHAQARRAISSVLDRDAIRAHAPRVRTIARTVLADQSPRFRIHDAMLRIALRSIAELLFGADAATVEDDLDEMLLPLARPWAFLPPLRVPFFGLTPWGRFEGARRRMRAWIGSRVASFEQGAAIDRETAIDQAVTVLATGREPMAAALVWSILRTSLRAGEVAVRAALGAAPSIEAVLSCAPLAAAIDAALRDHAPVPEVVRRTARTCPIAGRAVAAGTDLHGAIGLAARDDARHAFGGGVRRCLGFELARTTLAIVLAEWALDPRLSIRERAMPRAIRRNLVLVPRGGGRARRDPT